MIFVMNKLRNLRGVKMNAKNEKAKITDIFTGLTIVVAFLVGHLYFPPMLYIAAILTIALYAFNYKNIIALTVFFIPLARIMKFSPEAMTVLGIATIISLCIMLFNNKMQLGATELLIGVMFLILLLIKNTVGEFGFPFSYIRIALLLVLLPQCLDYYKKGKLSFNLQATAVMAFAGICTSSLIGIIWAEDPRLTNYIATEDIYYVGVTIFNRFCGLSSDPNYFSSLVLFSTALQLTCLINTKRSIYMIYAVILSAIGILTLSKMFLLLIALTWCVSIMVIMTDKSFSVKKQSKKGKILLLFSIGIVAFAVYFVRSGYFDVIVSRFGYEGASSITTGRSDIWKAYVLEISSSIKTMFLGSATNAETVGVHVTHNTPIQILWKLGIVGVFVVLVWYVALHIRTKRMTLAAHINPNKMTIILLLAQILPLFALDKFFFDEFYWYYIVYLLIRMNISDSIFVFEVKEHE